ncbi:hypothetical protein FQR65_LT13975 [Abscondita terminalis]|nr:hypothetical protein FQR65_LT13975 [Abscondita terminalis]
MLAIFVNILPQELRDTYLTTVVEQNQLAEKHIVRLGVKYVEGGLNTDIPEHKQYVEQVIIYLKKHLNDSIDNIIEEHQNKTSLRASYGIDVALFEELYRQTIFCQKAARCTRLAQCCLNWQPEAFLIVRFVGISEQSSSIHQLLYSITNQCSILTYGHKIYKAHVSIPPPSSTTLGFDYIFVAEYRNLCRSSSNFTERDMFARPLIILIDGIDQVNYFNSYTIDWLPNKLPDNIKLILTIAEECNIYDDLKTKIDAKYFIKMSPLEETEAKGILLSSVMQYNHSVNSTIKDCVLMSVQHCTLPLYVKVLAWQTSWCSDKEHDIVPKGNINDQLSQMLDKLEKLLGVTQVQHALALVTCTKLGITDSEMIDLLAFNECFHNSGTYVVWAPACLMWSRLIKHLAPFLQWTLAGGVLGVHWRDNTLLQAVKERYKQHTPWANKMLYDYYTVRNVFNSEINAQPSYNLRKLDELPYQYYQMNPNEMQNSMYLNDLNWIYDKLCGSNSFQLLEDIYMSHGDGTSNNKFVDVLRDFLEKYAHVLNYDGRQFYGQFYYYLRDLEKSNKEMIVLNDKIDSDNEMVSIKSMFPNKILNLILRLPGTEQFVVSVSTSLEEICVWDIIKCNKVRTMKGVTHPINLIPIDQTKCIVLCKRELKIYDLDSGCFINKLKGVMNQKMPYYGLNDQSHLVALSRNRMYVNLMNLETGDCVATFKVGEDRFLNSLLVSGDGRILVCGDEVQKPFPLLVWSLTSKKLIYDLRIPHHDFITSLSAITYEGNYVCCVCHEIDEPNPNFIVVYDLQSGTLFKKWKTTCSTVAIEISSQGSCVISGLEDARILVWDLITGNCRWSLCGHTAPVSFLRLDPTGAFCISGDALGRDKSIRVWDLTKGNLVAVYTPKANITACEIMSGGKHIVLAVEGSCNIITLELRGPNVEIEETNNIYGNPENQGKIFELKESEQC